MGHRLGDLYTEEGDHKDGETASQGIDYNPHNACKACIVARGGYGPGAHRSSVEGPCNPADVLRAASGDELLSVRDLGLFALV